jgi:hypothetical protein
MSRERERKQSLVIEMNESGVDSTTGRSFGVCGHDSGRRRQSPCVRESCLFDSCLDGVTGRSIASCLALGPERWLSWFRLRWCFRLVCLLLLV